MFQIQYLSFRVRNMQIQAKKRGISRWTGFVVFLAGSGSEAWSLEGIIIYHPLSKGKHFCCEFFYLSLWGIPLGDTYLLSHLGWSKSRTHLCDVALCIVKVVVLPVSIIINSESQFQQQWANNGASKTVLWIEITQVSLWPFTIASDPSCLLFLQHNLELFFSLWEKKMQFPTISPLSIFRKFQ